MSPAIVRRHGQQLRIEAPADHRRRLQQRAVLRREPIDARRQQALHARRQRRRYRAGVEFHFSRRNAQHAALGEEAHDFLGEQRVALGLFRQLPRQEPRARPQRRAALDQTPDIARRQRLQTQRRHDGCFAPGGSIFRSPRMEDQEPQLGLAVDDLAQHLLRDAVDPMQVLDQQHDRREAAARFQQSAATSRACAGRSARRRARRARPPAV